MIPSSRSKLSDLYTLSHSKLLENHILHSGTYLYSPYMAVPLPELGLVPWSIIFPYLNTLLSMNINVVEWITLKRIWRNISNVYLRTAWLEMWLVGRLTRQISVTVEGPKEFPNCSALKKFLWVTYLFMVKLLFDYSLWTDQFPYFRIQPQTIRGFWEWASLENLIKEFSKAFAFGKLTREK